MRGLDNGLVVAPAGVRITLSVGLGLAVFGGTSAVAAWQVAVLVGWDVAAATFVLWVLAAVSHRDSVATQALATREDDSRVAAEIVVLCAGLISLVGVGSALLKGAKEHGSLEVLLTGLGVATVVLSWSAVQTVFTLRYAHLYYSEGGGIDFNEHEDGDVDPDYGDFAYLALTIGMTYQVSDTDLTRKSIRRTATRQALLSYVFGTFVLAVTINVVAGLVK